MELLTAFSSNFFKLLFLVFILFSVQFGLSLLACIPYWISYDGYDRPVFKYITMAISIFLMIVMIPNTVKVAHFFSEQDNPIPVEVVKTEIRQYKLVNIYPPKHMYVDIMDVQTGQIFQHQYVTNYCTNWSANRPGDTYSIEIVYFKQGNDKLWIEFQNMYRTFCS
ncbi:hypothetical protein RsoM2USA_153 [Ralstonia phage RsoM2USA]|nr:hypothetical protein RsoM2USA_153 [Ralstonia phage RsoM2USA]